MLGERTESMLAKSISVWYAELTKLFSSFTYPSQFSCLFPYLPCFDNKNTQTENTSEYPNYLSDSFN
jgi:hypothetical protein